MQWPAAKPLNYIGLYGINVYGPGCVDVGVYEPLGELVWILTELEERGALRINCGGERYEAADGTVWSADRFYGFARPFEVDAETEIEGTDDDPLYRTLRWYRKSDLHSGWYQIPVPNGTYEVTLHFAELKPEHVQEHPRAFDVLIERYLVLEGHDVAAASGMLTAEQHTFEILVEDGWLDVDFERKTEDPFVNALEIERVE